MELSTKWRREARTAAEQVPVAAGQAQQAQADAAQAVKDAAATEKSARESARQAEAELTVVRRHASSRLDELEKRFAAAHASADGPVRLGIRGIAREALYAGAVMSKIPQLAVDDEGVAGLHAVWSAISKLLIEVGTGQLELAEDDPAVRRADALEISAWSAMLNRVRVCAGESNG